MMTWIMRNDTAQKRSGDDLYDISCNHTQVAGVLAGFSIAIAALLVDGLKTHSDLHRFTMGLFVLSFFGFICTGLLYSLVRHGSENHEYFLFSVASATYYFSVVCTFNALRPFVEIVQYDDLKWTIHVVIFGTIVGGWAAVGIPLYDLLAIRGRALFWSFLIAFATGGVFYVSIGRVTPKLASSLFPIFAFFIALVFAVSVVTFYCSRPKEPDETSGQAPPGGPAAEPEHSAGTDKPPDREQNGPDGFVIGAWVIAIVLATLAICLTAMRMRFIF